MAKKIEPPTDGSSWESFTGLVRELAESVRKGYSDPHHIAETLRSCAATIDEMDHRIQMSDIWIAGTGRFEEFEKTLQQLKRS